MLRKKDSDGWSLITHPAHARLAGEFATRWSNKQFAAPVPREEVLDAIFHHDDGWLVRDNNPQITRQGLPSAFSVELVGKYSAFEEIDLADYLAVRRSALEIIAQRNPYAAVLVSMHTYNLLAERSDRSTIKEKDLSLLDAFLAEQKATQDALRAQLRDGEKYPADKVSEEAFLEHFYLLQACDCLSLLACVDYEHPSDLLHQLPTRQGQRVKINYVRKDSDVYALDPFPFAGHEQKFRVPYRRISQRTFSSSAELNSLYHAAAMEHRELTFLAL